MDQAPTPTLEPLKERFTLDGSDELESFLANLCHQFRDKILECVPATKVELLLLGGGYGRGEGGVLRTWQGDKPYNDLEFYLFLSGPTVVNHKLYGPQIHHICEELTEKAGLEVEVKILSLNRLTSGHASMFFYDLVSGHKIIYGSPNSLKAAQHHRSAERIPLHEATRLLMNRCSGLLYAKERLQRESFGAAESDFVFRNICKAKLAVGDAVLAALGKYDWSCRERHQRLSHLEGDQLPFDLVKLRAMHAEGVEFKLHPILSNASRKELAREHSEISSIAQQVWLWLESMRLKETFPSTRAYGLSTTRKCPETFLLKNWIINAREFGVGTIFKPEATLYPRERLLNSLPLMLWENDFKSDLTSVRHVQQQVRCHSTDLASLVGAYENIWRKFN